MSTNWNVRFYELAIHISTWSKDKNTKVGCVIVDDDKRVVSMGYNGLPAGADDEIEWRQGRPQKYMYFEHAERNALYSCAKLGHKTDGCIMYSTLFPCADCARAIIQSGIKRLVCPTPDFEDPAKGPSWKVALELLRECKVELDLFDLEK